MSDENETYKAMVSCGNCNNFKEVDLEKGITVDSHRGKTRCKVCGCFMLPGGKRSL